eukprot:RCo030977
MDVCADEPSSEQDQDGSDSEDPEEEDGVVLGPQTVSKDMLLRMAMNGDAEILEQCLEGKCNVDSKDQFGMTLLHWASCNGRPSAVKVLLKYGALHDAKNSWGETPAVLAKRKGHTEVLDLLEGREVASGMASLSLGAGPSSSGTT